MESKSYVYEALPTDRHQIRVLHLLPTTEWHNEVRCKLTTVSLDDEPYFEALSYVWGDPKDTVDVQLDGCVFSVTSNLIAALRRLRKRTEERIIWVDQLCINQRDVEEKSFQVAFMPHIYKSCAEALLWLGEIEDVDEITVEETHRNEPNSESLATAGLGLIEEFGNGKHLHEAYCFERVDDITLIPSPEHKRSLEGFRLIAGLPYWDRVWVVQEIVLPSKLTAILGSASISWDSFLSGAVNWLDHSVSCCRTLGDSLPLETKHLILLFFSKLLKMAEISGSRRLVEQYHLVNLLIVTRSRIALDPRDKVFSLLGLVDTWLHAAPIVPDYKLTTLQVYAQVTENIITSLGGVLFVFCGNHLRRPEFPSWVHDWAAEDHSPFPYENGWGEVLWNMYSASNGAVATIKRYGDSVLLIDGNYVDRVIVVGDPMEVHDWKSSVPVYDSWVKMTGVDKHPEQSYVAGGDIDNALWSCIIGDAGYAGDPTGPAESRFRRATREDYKGYEAWKMEIRTAVDGQWMLSADTIQIMMTAPITARHRRMFITERGYFGMGPLKTAVGDEVYVLPGSTVPFVHRPAILPTDEGYAPLDQSIKVQNLVGECYVHGIMYGEFLSHSETKTETIALC